MITSTYAFLAVTDEKCLGTQIIWELKNDKNAQIFTMISWNKYKVDRIPKICCVNYYTKHLDLNNTALRGENKGCRTKTILVVAAQDLICYSDVVTAPGI